MYRKIVLAQQANSVYNASIGTRKHDPKNTETLAR
jgi:hypothetical protein